MKPIALITGLLTLAVPAAEQAKYVHLNPATKDVEMVFPERLEAKDFNQNPGPLKKITVVLANHSEPTFQTTVETGSAAVTYRYVVHNGGSARQAINRIYTVVPPSATDAECSDPPKGWICMSAIPTPADDRALYYVNPEGRFLRLATPLGRGNASLKPGDTMAYEVRSKARPGFIRTYVESGFVDAPPDLPGAVYDELHPYLTIEGSMRRCLILGPAFVPGTSIRAMASELEDAVTQLASERVINRRSEFVTAAMSVLRAAKTTNAAQPIPKGMVPHNDVERDVDIAVRYDVGVRPQ